MLHVVFVLIANPFFRIFNRVTGILPESNRFLGKSFESVMFLGITLLTGTVNGSGSSLFFVGWIIYKLAWAI